MGHIHLRSADPSNLQSRDPASVPVHVWFIVIHLLLWAKLIGRGCSTALVAGANRDTFHILLNHMQLYQSPDSLTWHIASGSILLILGSEGWPARAVGRKNTTSWAPAEFSPYENLTYPTLAIEKSCMRAVCSVRSGHGCIASCTPSL